MLYNYPRHVPILVITIRNFLSVTLRHFLLDFLVKIICTQGLEWHVLGPLLVHFKTCEFIMIRRQFEYSSEKNTLWASKCSLWRSDFYPISSMRCFMDGFLGQNISKFGRIYNTYRVVSRAIKHECIPFVTYLHRVKAYIQCTSWLMNQ